MFMFKSIFLIKNISFLILQKAIFVSDRRNIFT